MAPAGSLRAPRLLWVWSLPSLVVLLSLVWYKRRRDTLGSDPGGTPGTPELQPDADAVPNTEPLHAEEPVTAASLPDAVEAPPVAPASEESILAVAAPKLEAAPVACGLTVCQGPAETVSTEEVARLHEAEKECAPVAEVAGEQEEGASRDIADPEDPENPEAAAPEACPRPEDRPDDDMKGTTEAHADAAPSAPPKDEKGDSKVAALEGKLASLALSSAEEQQRGERDSANHSPVDAMLASPTMSSYSDEHSEGSSDSGKGCSDVASPPSRTPVGGGSVAGDADNGVESTSTFSVYEFLLPQLLVGRLIGRHGAFVHEIKAKTNASIWIKKHPETSKQKICSIEGSASDIDNALGLIRHRFPTNKYPNVTLEQISVAAVPATFPLVPDFCQLHLVEGVNNEVMISSLVSPAHMFVQQPYHPSYQFLQRLNHVMNSIYANVDTPNLPDPIEGGNICVAPAIDGWYRAQVVSSNEETQTSEIKFVDYGGYMSVNNSVLRQIRQDFMTLPFQATECYLANIKPSGESGEWSLDALRIVEELTRGQMLLAQVYDYAADGVPLIYLYSSVNSQPWMYDPEVVLINQELVARGMADLDDSVVSSQTSEAASLVVAAKAVATAAAGETSSNAPTVAPAASSTSESEGKPAAVEPSSLSEVTAN